MLVSMGDTRPDFPDIGNFWCWSDMLYLQLGLWNNLYLHKKQLSYQPSIKNHVQSVLFNLNE